MDISELLTFVLVLVGLYYIRQGFLMIEMINLLISHDQTSFGNNSLTHFLHRPDVLMIAGGLCFAIGGITTSSGGIFLAIAGYMLVRLANRKLEDISF